MAAMETTSGSGSRYIEWGPIFAGAVGAAALSFLLLTFGGAIGLSLTSPWPDTGARLWVVALAVMWWAVIVQIGSFAAGGYLAGRMRSRWGTATSTESEFRDSAHGFMVWAVGVLFGAIILAIVGLSSAKTAAQSASTVAAGATAGATAKPSGPADYAVDLLLRPASSTTVSTTTPANSAADDGLRSETSRIFTGAITNRTMSDRDRTYLTQVVTTRTGLPQADAQKRVDDAIAEASKLEQQAREKADKARRAAIITAFMAAASLLMSLVVACAAASLGGRHRDENRVPLFAGHRFW